MPCHASFAQLKTLFTRPEFSAKFRTWLVDPEEFDAAREVLANEIGFLVVDVPTEDDEEGDSSAAAAAGDGTGGDDDDDE